METSAESFNSMMLVWQVLLIVGAVAAVYFIYRLVKHLFVSKSSA